MAPEQKASTALTVSPQEREIISSLVINNDLSKLTQEQQIKYYWLFCESLGLNPLTKPFDLVNLQGKRVLYANKNCAEQLRRNNGVSFLELHQQIINDECVTTVKGQDKTGRVDVEVGVVNIKGLSGNDLANAMMKSSTKAKRRLTLSLCSVGVMDETELETVPGAERMEINITGMATATEPAPAQESSPAATHAQPPSGKPQPTQAPKAKNSKLTDEAKLTIRDMCQEMIDAGHDNWSTKRMDLKIQKGQMLGDDAILAEVQKEYNAFKRTAAPKAEPATDDIPF